MPAASPGPALSEEGARQAEQAAAYIAGRRPSLPPIGGLYTSPLLRTRQTAAPIGAALGLKPALARGLMDCDAGEWSGVTLKELAKKPEWAIVVHYPSSFHFPGGESIAEMQARSVSTVRALAERHPGQTVIAVSHADPIKAVLADALGVHLDLFQRLMVSPASVSAITYGTSSPTVTLVNWTAPELVGADAAGSAAPGAARRKTT
jgi:probable phosphoglycerate mutase